MKFKSEAAMAAVLVERLREEGWEVWQEVAFRNHVIDIVAQRGKIIWVIECKQQLSLSVVEQAIRSRSYAHHVSIAAPGTLKLLKYNQKTLMAKVMEWQGVGAISVDRQTVRQAVAPAINRSAQTTQLNNTLKRSPKNYAAAGNNKSQYWSPFKATCQSVREYVRLNPGTTFQQMLGEINTHYKTLANARQSLVHWAKRGLIPGVRVSREGARLKLYSNGQEGAKQF